MALAGCARAPGVDPPGAPPAERGAAAREAAEALQAAEALHEVGRHAEAAARADSLFAAWLPEPALAAVAHRALWLEARALEATGDLAGARDHLEQLLERLDEGGPRREAAAQLAALLHATGETVPAVRLLLEEPEAVGDPEMAILREAALQLSVEDLESLASDHPLESAPSLVVHGELARALALADRLDSARTVARRVASAAPEGSEDQAAARALLALDAGSIRRARIGAVLPLSGRFEAVGRLLEEGMRLALEEYRRSAPGGIEIDLVVEDDGSSAERAVELAARLEEEGALVVLGPVRSEPFAAAARARRNPRLLLLSPTATRAAPAPGAYTLWAHERRERAVAHDVGRWIAEELRLRRTAVLHPMTPGGRAAAAGFEEGVTAGGGEVVGVAAYHPDSTTFAGPIAELAVLGPDAVYVATGSAREVLQIAPQLHYYGLDRSVVAGGPDWSDPTVVRRLDRFAADHRVVGAWADRIGEGTPWARFREAYEREYRKSLRDNILPALGYDAVKVALAALGGAGLPLPGAVSRAAGSLEVPGATGLLRTVPEASTVDRRTLIRMLVDGRLVPAEPAAVLAWLERARFRADSVAGARADSIARARRGDDPPR